jgi:RNA polymerase sigma-70 factor (ECF subfamily)
MTQDELLVLIYKKTKEHLHIYMICIQKSISVINVLVRNREEAEDVLQDVFVKIWKNIDSILIVKDVSIPGY